MKCFIISFDACGCSGDWQMDNFIEKTVAAPLRAHCDKKVILGLSGGVDLLRGSGACCSRGGCVLCLPGCVCGTRAKNAQGRGRFRKDPFLFDMNFGAVNQERFLRGTEGRHRPGAKRKIIGIRVL